MPLAESESPLAPLRVHTQNLNARFCNCVVSARQERDLAMAHFL